MVDVRGVRRWLDAIDEDIRHPPDDDFSVLKQEDDWIEGIERLDRFCAFVLVETRVIFPLIHLQFEMFLEFLPAFIPTIFGKALFMQYPTKIHQLLGTRHRCPFVVYVGSRRDGKTVCLSRCIAGLLIHGKGLGGSTVLPGFGPVLKTPKRMVASVSGILCDSRLDDYFRQYTEHKTKPIKEAVTVFLRGGREMRFQALTLTPENVRGLSSILDFADEFFTMKYKHIQPLMIVRYIEVGCGGVVITTPNYLNRWTDRFTRSSKTVRVIYKARICKACGLRSTRGEADMDDVLEACQDAGHVEPQDVPWKSKVYEKAWGQYLDADVQLQELYGGAVGSSDIFQFRSVVESSRLFDYRVTLTHYERFDIGFDPSGHSMGNRASECAISMVGYTGTGTFHWLAADAQQLHEHTDMIRWAVDRISEYVRRFAQEKTNGHLVRVYVWVERITNDGYSIQEGLIRKGLDHQVRVMKGTTLVRGTFRRHGVPKTKELSRLYTNTLASLIRRKKFLISERFYSVSGRPDKIIDKFEEQLGNYVVNEKGKLTGKETESGKPAKDDLLISTEMPPYLCLESMNPNSPFHAQLMFSRDDLINDLEEERGLERM